MSASQASGKFFLPCFLLIILVTFITIRLCVRPPPPQRVQTAAKLRTTAGTTRRRRMTMTRGLRRRHICVLSSGMFILFYFYTILMCFLQLDYVFKTISIALSLLKSPVSQPQPYVLHLLDPF